ncbi:MAG: TonB-dependent receptor [Bacteroides sp.]|nr:TonB-dependent receptor [Bacteroides sp.]
MDNLFKHNTKGLVGRFNYDYMSKYIAEFSFRYDGSSRFPKGQQWGFFPSVFAGWRISEESFIKNTDALSFLTNLKLRASYGEVGDDSSSTYQFVSGYNYPATGGHWQTLAPGYIFDDVFVNSVGFRVLPNPNITWYQAKMYNAGIDGDILNGFTGF